VQAGGVNADDWMVSNVLIQNCLGHGFHVRGGEANSGVAVNLHSSSNRQWGIHDEGFLGNQYIACDCESNGTVSKTMSISSVAATNEADQHFVVTTQSLHNLSTGESVTIENSGFPSANGADGTWTILRTGNTTFALFGSNGPANGTRSGGIAQSKTVGGPYYIAIPTTGTYTTLVGCYSEQNQNPSRLNSGQAVAIGGLNAAGFAKLSPGTIITAGAFNTPLHVNSDFVHGGTTEAFLGAFDRPAVLSWQAPWEKQATYLEFRNTFPDPINYPREKLPHWICYSLDSSAFAAFSITGFNHREGPCRFKAPRGLFVGPDIIHSSGTDLRYDSGPMLTSASAPPSGLGRDKSQQNYWRIGDRILNTEPLTNGVDSWIATSRGAWVWGTAVSSEDNSVTPSWKPERQYNAGDFIASDSYTYRAIQNGIGMSAPIQPTMPTTAGVAVKDIVGLGLVAWQKFTSYGTGKLVLSDPINDNGYVYQCAVLPTPDGAPRSMGVSGSGPTWMTTPTQDTIDGELIWKCVYSYVIWECFAQTNATFSPRMALGGRLRHDMTADQDYSLARTEWLYSIIEITDTQPFLTKERNILLPAFDGAEWIVYNNTKQSLAFLSFPPNPPLATVTSPSVPLVPVSVAPGMRQSLYCDGTNVQPAGSAVYNP
jgi:hypothetical protein